MNGRFIHRPGLALIVTTSVALICALLPPAGVASGAAARAPDEAAMYAIDQGITRAEALRRLGVMDQATELDANVQQTFPSSYAGVFIQHKPVFKIVVQSTNGGDWAVASAAAEKIGLGTEWEFRVVAHSAAALRADAEYVVSELGAKANVWADIKSNTVQVQVLEDSQLPALLPATVRPQVVPHLGGPTADIIGGVHLGGNGCTASFTVKKGTSPGFPTVRYGILTAGHCDNGVTYAGVQLPFQEELHYGSHDEQWHTAPGFTARNKVNIGNGLTLTISGVRYGPHTIGNFICKYGRITGYGCGYLDNNAFCATWVPGWGGAACTYHMISRNGTDLAERGDSGGPVFSSGKAYGMTSGQSWNTPSFCECNLVYTPIDYVVAGINVQILTQ